MTKDFAELWPDNKPRAFSSQHRKHVLTAEEPPPSGRSQLSTLSLHTSIAAAEEQRGCVEGRADRAVTPAPGNLPAQ